MTIDWLDIKDSINSISQYECTSNSGDEYYFNDEFDYQGSTIYAWGKYTDNMCDFELDGISCDDGAINSLFENMGLYEVARQIVNAKQ